MCTFILGHILQVCVHTFTYMHIHYIYRQIHPQYMHILADMCVENSVGTHK
jgi:2-iminoacetate synthase ThiH